MGQVLLRAHRLIPTIIRDMQIRHSPDKITRIPDTATHMPTPDIITRVRPPSRQVLRAIAPLLRSITAHTSHQVTPELIMQVRATAASRILNTGQILTPQVR
jgi:hypothetical protein